MDLVPLVSVISSAVIAVAGLFLGYRAGREQRKHESAVEKVRIKRDFLIENYRRRVTPYTDIWRILGAVSDVSLGDADRYEALLADPGRLRDATTRLEEHLYGEAGLLMDWNTRNRIHEARLEAMNFLSGSAGPDAGDRLVNAFYRARRALRNDLGIVDGKEPENIEKLTEPLSEGPAGS
jgi:hypothetical protein